MEDEEYEVAETDSENGESNIDSNVIAAIIASIVAVGLGIKAWRTSRKLKKEQEKNVAFQEIIRKHQAEIDALTSEKEHNEYLIQLYEEYISKAGK